MEEIRVANSLNRIEERLSLGEERERETFLEREYTFLMSVEAKKIIILNTILALELVINE